MEITIKSLLDAMGIDSPEPTPQQDKAVISALIALYHRQTADEQETRNTAHKNGMGFTARDADFLTSLAVQAIENRRLEKEGLLGSLRVLTPRQLEWVRKMITKYHRQLLEIAHEKAAAKAAEKGAKTEPVTAPAPSAPAPAPATAADFLTLAKNLTEKGCSLEDIATLLETMKAATAPKPVKAAEEPEPVKAPTIPTDEEFVSAWLTGQREAEEPIMAPRQPATESMLTADELKSRLGIAEEPAKEEWQPGPQSALVEIPGGYRWKTAAEHMIDSRNRWGTPDELKEAMKRTRKTGSRYESFDDYEIAMGLHLPNN